MKKNIKIIGNIWSNNENFPQVNVRQQSIYPGNTGNSKQDKSQNNLHIGIHFQTSENQREKNLEKNPDEKEHLNYRRANIKLNLAFQNQCKQEKRTASQKMFLKIFEEKENYKHQLHQVYIKNGRALDKE